MIFIINRKRYNTEKATVLATDQTHNSTRWSSLFKTTKDVYFAVHFTLWQGEKDVIIPDLSEDEAADLYEGLEPLVEWEEAFPTTPLAEA